jgi:hypothetical protein
MVRKNDAQRGVEKKKAKPRGKPFPKGNIRGKIDDQVLAAEGYSRSPDGGIITSTDDWIEKESTQNALQEDKKEITSDQAKDVKELVLIDSIDFMNGENKLSIRFSRRHNRMFRIQIFLNDIQEIRPMTYNGSSAATTFWNLLKGAMK